MGKIVPAEPAGQAPAADLRIAQVVQFARDPRALGLGGADHRAQARQDQHLIRRAALGDGERVSDRHKILRGGFFHLRGEHRLGVARGELAAGFR